MSHQEESYGNDTHGCNGYVNGSTFCIKEVSSQKAIKAAMNVMYMIALNLVMKGL